MDFIIHHEINLPTMAVPIYRDLLHPQIVEIMLKNNCDEYKIWVFGENLYSYNKFKQSYTRFSIN